MKQTTKEMKQTINKITDYIDLGIFYLGFILFIVGIWSFLRNEYMSGLIYRNVTWTGIAQSIMGVYFIRSYKKKDLFSE